MERSWFFARVIVAVALAFLLTVLALLGWQQLDLFKSKEGKTFFITAEGRVTAVPDVGQVALTVFTEGVSPQEAQDKNAEKINSITDFLKEEGVKAVDIKTSQFSLQPKYEYRQYPCPKVLTPERGINYSPEPCVPSESVLIGYTLSQSVNLKIRNLDKAGKLLSGAIGRGANQVGALVFSVEDKDAYRAVAMEAAVAKAKTQAENLARLGGFRVGKILSIQEGYGYNQPYPVKAGVEMPGVAPDQIAVAPQIEPGSQDVAVTVTVEFQMD